MATNSVHSHFTCTQRYVPHFKTMFSCLRHYPRQQVTLDMTDPVPSHVSRQWRGYGEHARETLIRYKRYAVVDSTVLFTLFPGLDAKYVLQTVVLLSSASRHSVFHLV